MDNGFYQQKEIGLREIVFKQQQKILEILSKELRLSKKVIPLGPNRADLVIEEEDTRVSFVQSVQAFGLILKPHFDEAMEKVYGDFDELCDYFTFEYYNKYKKYILELDSAERNTWGEDKNEKITSTRINKILLKERVRKAKQIFKELNLLLKRNDYLRGSVYGEDDDIDDIDSELNLGENQ